MEGKKNIICTTYTKIILEIDSDYDINRQLNAAYHDILTILKENKYKYLNCFTRNFIPIDEYETNKKIIVNRYEIHSKKNQGQIECKIKGVPSKKYIINSEDPNLRPSMLSLEMTITPHDIDLYDQINTYIEQLNDDSENKITIKKEVI